MIAAVTCMIRALVTFGKGRVALQFPVLNLHFRIYLIMLITIVLSFLLSLTAGTAIPAAAPPSSADSVQSLPAGYFTDCHILTHGTVPKLMFASALYPTHGHSAARLRASSQGPM